MSGGEIKNVLTLDVSKFESALDRATGNLKNLDKSLKSATQVAQEFEKNVTGLGSDIGSAADKFKLLEQTVGSLVSKLAQAANGGMETISTKTRKAKQDIDDFSKSAEKSGGTLLSMSDWTKRYATALESIKPSLQSTIKGQNDLTKATKDTAKAAEQSASEQIKSKIRQLENEQTTNAQIIEQKRKLAQDLRKIENQIRNESLSHKVNADGIQNRIGAYGGKNKIAVEMAEANRLDANADVIKGQIAEIGRLTTEYQRLNEVRAKNIVTLQSEAVAAEKSEAAIREAAFATIAAKKEEADQAKIAAKEKIEHERRVAQAAREASRAQVTAAKEAEAERKAIAHRAAQFEQEQARQIAQTWKGIGQLWAASKIGAGLSSGLNVASQEQQTEVRLKLLNLPKEEMEEFKKKAYDTSREEKYISVMDSLQARLDAFAAIGHNDPELIDKTINPALQNAQVMMAAGYEHGNRSDLIKNLYGFAEARQVMNDPNEVINSFDIARRVGVASAGKLNIADLETVARNIGDLRQSMNSEGWMSLATLMEQYKVAGSQGHGGAGAGVASVGTILKMMGLYASGKPLTNEAAKNLLGADILNESFEGGNVESFKNASQNNAQFQRMIKTAGFKGKEDMMADPIKFFSGLRAQVLAYTKSDKNKDRFYSPGADMDSDKSEAAALKSYFASMGMSQKTVDGMLTIMNKGFIERSGKVLETAKTSASLDDSVKAMKETWANAVTEMESGAKSLAGAFEPVLKPLSTIPKLLGEILSSAAHFVRENPLVGNLALATTAVAGLNLAFKGFSSTFGMIGNVSAALKTIAAGVDGSTVATQKASSGWFSFGSAAKGAEGATTTAAKSIVSNAASVASAQQTSTLAMYGNANAAAGVANASKAASAAQGAMSFASKGLSAALGLVGGPLGLISIALIAGISLWDQWGNRAKSAAEEARDKIQEALDVTRRLNKEKEFGVGDAGTLREGIEKADDRISVLTQSASPAAQQELADLRKKKAQLETKLAEVERRDTPTTTPPPKSPEIKDTSGLFDKQSRQFENSFQTAFADIVGKLSVAKLKVGTTLSGNASYEDQAKAEFASKWLQGDFDDGKDPSKRKFLKNGVAYNKNRGFTEDDINWNAKDSKTGITVQQYLAEAAALKKAEDQQKALSFSVQRANATNVEAEKAIDRLTDGHLKDTDAMKALNKEYAREEGRNPGVKDDQSYTDSKRKAVGNQATADYANAGADLIQKNKDIQAQLLDTEQGRLIASVNATYEAEVNKYKAIQDNLNKTIIEFEKAEKTKDETYINAIKAREMADENFTNFIKLQQSLRERALMSPMEKMLEDWRDGYKQLQSMGTSWANGFSDTIASALTTGRLDFSKFMTGVASDATRSAVNQGIGGVVGLFKPAKTADGKTDGVATDGITGLFSQVGSALKDFWGKITGSTNAVGEQSAAVAKSVVETISSTGTTITKTTAEGGATIAIEGMAVAATMAAEALVSLALSTSAEETAKAGSEIATGASDLLGAMDSFAANGAYFDGTMSYFANGGAFTNGIYSSPTLFKFANGGKFGVMGEAGPEAVMPLSRDANGRLGVAVQGSADSQAGSAAPVVNIAISVNKDGSTDTKATGEEASTWKRMADRVKGVVQQELVVQQRPGGLLYK